MSPRILLADDFSPNRLVGEAVLSGLGCRVVLAAGGGQAIECYSMDAFDGVFLDIEMPDRDGFSTARGIREMEREEQRKPAVIIALTGQEESGLLARVRDAGMDDVLPKPIREETVRAMLHKWGLISDVAGKEASGARTVPGSARLPGRPCRL